MQYVECPLTDLGYRVEVLDAPGEIFGLDNRVADEDGFEDDQRFAHLGLTGYPPDALLCIDRPGQDRTLAILPDGAALPEGVTEILAADVVDRLVGEYGWPVGTTLGTDGMPVRPRE